MKTKAQYYTTDRGKNWEKFTVELPPSATALGFHADKPDWIIYTGMDCEQGIWGDWLCTEKVKLLSS